MLSRPYIVAARRYVRFFVRGRQPAGVVRLSLEIIQYVARMAVQQALQGLRDPAAIRRAMMSWDHQHGERSVYPEGGMRRNILMHEAIYVASVAIMSAWEFFDRCPPQE